jgi:hypothetical protein
VALALPAAVLLVLLLWLFVQPSTPTEKKDFVQAVGVLLAALAGLGGLYFTWQGQKLTRENTEQQLEQARESTKDQLEQARESQERTQRLTEQGQITDRFTRAIAQLGETDEKGNPKLEIRLGGIYALERISKDSPDRDYSTVMEVLSAYVRQHTPTHSEEDTKPTEQTVPTASLEGPRIDIKAVLDVIGRRQEDRVPERYRIRPDFQSINFSRTNLVGADLSRANLSGANLSGAFLWGADLRGAFLWRAFLSGAFLSGAFLSGAALKYAKELTREQLEQSLGDENTELPEGLDMPRSWVEGEN